MEDKLLWGYNRAYLPNNSKSGHPMSRFSLQEHGQHVLEGARAFVENAASNPKVATVVAGSSMGMGYMSDEMVKNVAGQITLVAGAITAVVVMVIQITKLVRMMRGKE